MNPQTLIFDLDDTLIECNKYFRDATNKFADQMHEWFPNVSKEQIKEKQLEIDIKSIEKYGLNSSRFPESLVNTYKYYCDSEGREEKDSEMESVRIIGLQVFQIEVQAFPYMYEVLNELKEDGHRLYLFTGGDEANQSRKIIQLELETYFEDRVFIANHKNADALRKVLETVECSRESTWMIGNSLKTDISPALELGINTVHIPSDIEWSYNNNLDANVQQLGRVKTIKKLTDLPRFIRENSFESCYTNNSGFLANGQTGNVQPGI
ncbi:HAD family hydrolase [Peribacillus saganii]|uniref:HAD family hydrolase n=1 Tax=Peribacillus saganii TaxID=2303992 RepID=A0A372LQJ6_9BACI|nr:HAD family hydrolase [Peribacillus saganii]RFU70108.1 HAD family hydrolase [Peribacillus saganii]